MHGTLCLHHFVPEEISPQPVINVEFPGLLFRGVLVALLAALAALYPDHPPPTGAPERSTLSSWQLWLLIVPHPCRAQEAISESVIMIYL